MVTTLGRAAHGHHLEGVRSAAAAFTLNRWLKRHLLPSLNKTCYSSLQENHLPVLLQPTLMWKNSTEIEMLCLISASISSTVSASGKKIQRKKALV